MAWVRAIALALALASGGAAAEAEEAEPPKSHVDWIALPLVTFNTDLGLGAGVIAGAYFYQRGWVPYRHAIGLQSYVTRRGVQAHLLRYDGPRLLASTRVEARLEYRRELRAPFFGAGNISAPDFTGANPERRFEYDRLSPAFWVRVREKPLGPSEPLELYGGYGFRTVRVRAYPDSLLAAQQPLGISGGAAGQLFAGAFWDTRDEEEDPHRGGLEEVAVRAAISGLGSDFLFGGATAGERRFFPLGARLVLALRLVADAQWGQVPFFEWPTIGGLNAGEGVGGVSSVRGVPRNRFAGNLKLLSNTELRARLYEFTAWGSPVRIGALAFFDAGRVWHPWTPDGPLSVWHPGAGGGLRLARRAAVLRLDGAVDVETGRLAVYVAFGHMF